jgi:uncharacterized protein
MTRPEVTDPRTPPANLSLTDQDVTGRTGPLVAFILLSYVLSWPVWLLLPDTGSTFSLKVGAHWVEISTTHSVFRMLGDLGPGVAAIIVLAAGSGRNKVRQLLARVVPRNLKWMTIAILLPVALVVYALMCDGFHIREFLNLASMEKWLLVFAINLFFSPFWEEVGWRGYLLPRLETSMKPLAASIALGIVWAFWHTPLYLKEITGGRAGTAYLLCFFASLLLCFFALTLGLSILFAWAYNTTRGNLSVLILLHASLNSSNLTFLELAMTRAGMKPFYAVTLGTWVAVLALLLFVGPDLSYKRLQQRT